MSNLNLILSKLESIEKMIQETLNKDEILSFKQLCEHLELSKSYLYKLTMDGKIPSFKPFGKKLYFSKNEVDLFIKNTKGGK
jgi:excisionase family DNA binding protein